MSRILHVSDDDLLLSMQGLKYLEKVDHQDWKSKKTKYSLRYAYKGEPKTYEYGEGDEAKLKRDSMFDAVKVVLIKV